MIIKLGENIEINRIESAESCTSLVDQAVLDNFKKVAQNLKRIAPKAEDFLYFSAIMMHSAESTLINEDGTPRMTAKGETAKAHWDKTGGSWRWRSNDPSLKPYKNSNGDIFPEEELVKAHKKWVGKPLCIDHKSSSVDHIRGFIVDTYYDLSLKRVIALCALDKFNYPDLARKVSTGYSNSVSMGTAVGKAICSDCGTVAKVEADFCKCMRSRTCYGEINVDLNPIELSIVVNGADPQAKIKHIIAAQVNSLNSYVEVKEAEIKKLAERTYQVNLSYTDGDAPEDGAASGNISIHSTTLDGLRQDIEKALSEFEKINSTNNLSENNTNDMTLPQTQSSVAMDQSDLEATERNIAPPTDRYASDDNNVVSDQLQSIKTKLASMQNDLDKLATQFTNTSNKKQEEIMSGSKDNNLNKKGYFQGGGDVNEPTPGQVKYEKDGLNEKLRNTEDKQMVGQSPFPDTGPVDGMHPGYDSFDKSELDRKKMLARAEADERAVKRAAIVEKAKTRLEGIKEAFYNGTEEPTPGKAQYSVDPLNEKLREKEDKQMVGQKPFPGVGNVDGLHPSPDSADDKDELKRKEKLLRAALKARFVKAAKVDGSHDQANSAWEIYRGDQLLLTASVNDLTSGKIELYAGIATKEFGADLINKVRKLGADAVVAGFSKKAQDAAPVAPPADAGPAAVPAASGDVASPADVPQDSGAEGDPKATALELSEKVRDVASDALEAVRALTGEQAEMNDMGMVEDSVSADDSKVSTAMLQNMRKELNVGLTAALKETIASLNDHESELNTIANMYEKGAVNSGNKEAFSGLVEEAFVEAKEALANSFKLLGAFFKYAQGTDALTKRAAEQAFNKQANGDNMAGQHDSLMAMVDKGSSAQPAADALDAMLAEDMAAADALDADDDLAADDNDAGAVMTSDPNKAKEMADKGMDVKVMASLETKASRAEARAKIAAEMKWNPMLGEFHKHLEGPAFEVKPQADLGHVETVEEIHEKLLDVATTPVKLRKEAEAINTLIVEGKLEVADLDLLVANGADPAAVKYWKQFYGQAGSEGSQFAAELVKEHAKAQMEEEKSLYRVKIARAFELAHQMAERELIASDKGSISNQVEEIMQWNDNSFDSVKKVVMSSAPVVGLKKDASRRMPQVGFLGIDEGAPQGEGDFASQLNAAFAKSSKRSF